MERDILAGRVEPGAKLPTEKALAQQFAVGRSAVREAIARSHSAGVAGRCRPLPAGATRTPVNL